MGTKLLFLAAAVLCILAPSSSFLAGPSALPRPASLKREAAACTMQLRAEGGGMQRRQAAALLAGALLLPSSAWAAKKAPLSGADPADKQRLVEAVAAIAALEPKIKDPSAWPQVAEVVTKAPFTKDTMDAMFNKAAKSLPDNIQKIYGGDGGQWIGIKNEAVDAMDALAAEVTYLIKNKGSDATDLEQYYALARAKSEEFVSLYTNSDINKQLKGVGFCAYSSSAKCDEFDDNKDVQAQKEGGGIYNQLRFGAKERQFGGGVDESGKAKTQ